VALDVAADERAERQHRGARLTGGIQRAPGEHGAERAAFEGWLAAFLGARGDDVFRLKGIVAFAGDDRRHVLQGVHRIRELRAAKPWGGDKPSSKLVFIGRNLDGENLQRGFNDCLK
jgi:G3E family GTPase